MRSMHESPALFLCLVLACAPGDQAADSAAADSAVTARMPAEAQQDFAITDAVFSTPESVLYDEQADLYYVSNINGSPAEHDDNGFITRVRPDGTIDTPRWIDGASDIVMLHAPKGMAVVGDTLWVADIDTVRAFHRTTGAPLAARGVVGASFLNDVAAGPEGAVYVTDTGVDASFAPTGRDAVLRLTATGATPVASGAVLANPNGIVVQDGAIVVVPFGGAAVLRVPLDGGAPDTLATLPAGQLDGIVRTRDGGFLVSSWEGSTVYRIAPDGSVSALAENLEAPADLGYDTRRQRLLVPLFNGNRIEVRTIR